MEVRPMTQPVGPYFPTSTAFVPTLPALNISDDEQAILSWLQRRLIDIRGALLVSGRYYDGEQRVQDLGISIPKNLQNLRVPVGWARVGVDALAERLHIDGFRYPGATDVDPDLDAIWDANDLDAESTFADLDAFIYGRSYLVAGVGETPDAPPLITCESPLNMTGLWNPRTRRATAVYGNYIDRKFGSDTYGQQVACLLLPGRTISMTQSGGKWEIVDRDDHGLDFVPVARLANRQRISARDGESEITREQRAIIDAATRTLLGAEVARELFAMPRRWAVGVAEEQFQKADGTPVSKFDAAMSAVWAFPRPEDSDINPQVGQFAASDPTAFKTLVDMYAQQFASLAALPPHYVGLLSDGNPASAEAILENESRLVRRADGKKPGFGAEWTRVMQYALMLRDGTDVPPRIECDWADSETPTIAQASDAMQKQVAAGIVSPFSDVVLKRLGYSAVERQILAADRKKDQGAQVLAELANSLQAKQARTDLTVTKDISTGSSVTPNDGTGNKPGA
jgi:hypothetical protein